MDNLRADAQRAAAAGRLYAADAPLQQCGAGLSQHQTLYAEIKLFITGGRQIGFGHLLVHQRTLGETHRFKHRAYSFLIHINADGQVDLVRIGVGATGGGDTEDGVGGELLQVLAA